MKKAIVLAYGILSYTLFLGVFLYLVAFLGDFLLPRTIDKGQEMPFGYALLINLGLLVLFGVQHSVMARPGFKEMWTRIIPKSIERSTYVLLSSLVFVLIFALWRPMNGTLWDVSGTPFEPVAWSLYAFGWAFLLASTFLINHFELFGLSQVVHNARGTTAKPLAFTERFFYRFVRHPLYVGWTIAFWATPTMTLGHLMFAAGMTLYILVAIPLEERDLVAIHGARYENYRDRVPTLLPRMTPAPPESTDPEPTI